MLDIFIKWYWITTLHSNNSRINMTLFLQTVDTAIKDIRAMMMRNVGKDIKLISLKLLFKP